MILRLYERSAHGTGRKLLSEHQSDFRSRCLPAVIVCDGKTFVFVCMEDKYRSEWWLTPEQQTHARYMLTDPVDISDKKEKEAK